MNNISICMDCNQEITDEQTWKDFSYAGQSGIVHYDWEEFKTNCPNVLEDI